MPVSIIELLGTLTPLLTTAVSLGLILLSWVLRRHERAIKKLQRARKRHGRTLYGDDKDIQQTGLSEDLHTLTEQVEQLSDRVDKQEEKIDEIRDHVRELNGYDENE